MLWRKVLFAIPFAIAWLSFQLGRVVGFVFYLAVGAILLAALVVGGFLAPLAIGANSARFWNQQFGEWWAIPLTLITFAAAVVVCVMFLLGGAWVWGFVRELHAPTDEPMDREAFSKSWRAMTDREAITERRRINRENKELTRQRRADERRRDERNKELTRQRRAELKRQRRAERKRQRRGSEPGA
jgi:signal transduction histidine kinase